MRFERTELFPGVMFNYAGTDKFKKNDLGVHFILPHTRETAAASTLVGDVMTRGTASFPDLLSLEKELDDCYGASVSADASLKGEAKIVSISLEVIGNEYAFDGEDIFSRAFSVLREVLFCPATENGAFRRDYVESEKEKLICAIRRRKNNKQGYAIRQCRAAMCEGEPCGIPSYGSEEDVAALDERGLYAFYRKMIGEAPVELFFVGSTPREEVAAALTELFRGRERKSVLPLPFPGRIHPEKVRRLCEDTDYKQSVLVMGMRVLSDPADKEAGYAFAVFNSLFGSGANSRLFRYVREKLHLCYYAACAPDLTVGTAFIYTGIDEKNETVARKEILRQLDAVKNGEFSDGEIEDSRATLINAYEEIEDSADALANWTLGKVIYGIYESNDDVIEGIRRVTRDGITRAAQTVLSDTVFLLRGTAKHGADAEGTAETDEGRDGE